jgi:hypothetical protein
LPDDDSLRPSLPSQHVAIVLIDHIDFVADRAMAVGRLASDDHTRFVHFDIDGEETKQLEEAWRHDQPGRQLEVVPAPIRELADSVASFVRTAKRDHDVLVTVVLGRIVSRWWQRPLHVDEAMAARSVLLREPRTVLILVPFRL